MSTKIDWRLVDLCSCIKDLSFNIEELRRDINHGKLENIDTSSFYRIEDKLNEIQNTISELEFNK